jgi:plastin-1
METLKLQKKYPEVSRDEMFDLVNRFKYVLPFVISSLELICLRSAINTDTPGRIDKPSVLQSLQSSGESYDRARETLKHVSVDASGKLELEDWVEVSSSPLP